METKPTVYVVDYRDDVMGSCYLLSATCRICQERHVALLHRGQAPKPNDQYDRCPFCENAGTVYYGPLREALKMLTGAPCRLLYDDPQGGFTVVSLSNIVIETFAAFHVSCAQPVGTVSFQAKVYDNG